MPNKDPVGCGGGKVALTRRMSTWADANSDFCTQEDRTAYIAHARGQAAAFLAALGEEVKHAASVSSGSTRLQ